MLVSSSIRLTLASVGNAKIVRSKLGPALKHYAILSLKLNPDRLGGTCLCSSRQHNSKFVSPDHEDEHFSENEESMYMYQKLSRKENVDRLMQCIGCSESLAQSMLRELPKLRYITSSEISRKIKFLNENGVSLESILKNYWLLTLKIDEMEKKLAILSELKVSCNSLAAPLLQFPLDSLKDLANWSQDIVWRDKTKMSVLCSKLKCDPADIALAASFHKFIQTVPFDRMVKILDILLAEGVPPSKIIRDMWVVRYKVDQVQNRVMRAREEGIEEFKTWMVRCTEKILNNTIRLQAEKRALLGPHNDSMVEYISSRLNVTREEAELVLRRHPQLRGVGAAKLSNTLDFLIGKEGLDSKGKSSDGDEVGAKFDRIQIWSSSRILCHSLETMKARLNRLRALGYEPRNPTILYKSKRKYEEFVQKLEEKQALGEKSEEVTPFEPNIKETSEASPKDASM